MADNMKLDPVRMEKVYKYVEEHLGYTKKQWDLYRNSQAEIESMGGKYISDPNNVHYIKSYSVAGGSNDHYDGRYQLGEAAKIDGARYYKIKNPGHGDPDDKKRVAFRNDPTLQEEMLAGFTVANHNFIMKSKSETAVSEYSNADPLKRMQYLAHSHNSGYGNLVKYLETGNEFVDGFNTKSIKYMDNLKYNAILQNESFQDTVEDDIDFRVSNIGNVPLDKSGMKGKIKYGR